MRVDIKTRDSYIASNGDLIVAKQLNDINFGEMIHYIIALEGLDEKYRLHCLESNRIIHGFQDKSIEGLINKLMSSNRIELLEIIPSDKFKISRI
ncbi:hypothetical protein [Viridibacillus arvi]|uniref:hypothetical protein n=1 Tax=Viridibacillus arvi TaxID=263475 RepID=UPI0034CE47A4